MIEYFHNAQRELGGDMQRKIVVIIRRNIHCKYEVAVNVNKPFCLKSFSLCT